MASSKPVKQGFLPQVEDADAFHGEATAEKILEAMEEVEGEHARLKAEMKARQIGVRTSFPTRANNFGIYRRNELINHTFAETYSTLH